MLPCGCPDTSLARLHSYLDVSPHEDALTACVVAAFNASRARDSLGRLLGAFVSDAAELRWVWEAFAAGCPVYAQLLTGPSRPDMLICVDRGLGQPEVAAIVEVKIGAEFNVPELRNDGLQRWAAAGLRPHLKLWTNPINDRPGVPQTDTYALFEFETGGCAPGHTGGARPVVRHAIPYTAHRLLYPQPVAAAAATEPSVTGHLWQTTSYAELADALTPRTPAHADTPGLAWDRALAEVLRTLVAGKGRHKQNRHLPGVTPTQVRAAAAAATVPSMPLDGTQPVRQRPGYDVTDTTLDFLYGLQVDWDNQKAASVPHHILRHETLAPWSYTLVPTAVDWVNDAGRSERDETTGRPFRVSYDELPHRFVLRSGSTGLRRLEVHAGIGHAARFGWRESEELHRMWPDGFPTAAGHLVVTTRGDSNVAPAEPPEAGLWQALTAALDPLGAVAHDVRTFIPGERICAWFTYPPFPDERCPCEEHPGAAACQHTTTGQMLQAAMHALPVVLAYDARHRLDRTEPYPIWAAHQG